MVAESKPYFSALLVLASSPFSSLLSVDEDEAMSQ
jgi:hypothetical protein